MAFLRSRFPACPAKMGQKAHDKKRDSCYIKVTVILNAIIRRSFMKTCVLAFIIFSAVSLKAVAGSSVGDITSSYTAASGKQISAGTLTKLRGYKVLLVPGFLARPQMIGGVYFANYEDWFKKQGVDCELVNIHTHDSMQTNGDAIAQAVFDSPKPVILIGHSKGGLDTLDALMSHPEIWPKVKGFIALQSPFKGTPVADASVLKTTLDAVASLGAPNNELHQALENLKPEFMLPYLKSHNEKIYELEHKVPVLCVASKTSAGAISKGMLPLFNQMQSAKLPNDGMVPLVNEILPGARYIKLPDADHATLVFKTEKHFDQVKFLKTILTLTLSK